MLIKLFLTFLKIGFFSFGGAYSFLPLFQKEIVEKNNWLSNEEILNITAISQIVPGAISIKFATYTGYKIAGALGAIIANFANFLPPAVLILFLMHFYFKFNNLLWVKKAFVVINFIVAALIISSVLKIIVNNNSTNNIFSLFLVITLGIIFAFFIKVHPAYIILITGVISLIIFKNFL